MAMYDSEQFWQDFMRRPDAQKALKLEQKMLIKEHASELSNQYDAESAELKEALLKCSEPVKRLVAPIVKYQMIHRILHNLLKECKLKQMDFNEELSKENGTIACQLKALHNEWKGDPQNLKALEAKWSRLCLEAKETIDQDSYSDGKHTVADIPREELAERLSKGEIMPRDEWIPGISKGKRKLDSNSLKQHLTLGEQMRRDGREAFEKKDYQMALTRFTQGVQLLNWVEGTNSNDNGLLEEMYVGHLRNQALAALKCNKYNEALKACNTIIQDIDEHDGKARYRRGKAYSLLGMTKHAKDDYLFIIKSPYSDRESVKAAKAALNELREILSKYKCDARGLLEKSLAQDLFSEGRDLEETQEASETRIQEGASAVKGRRQWFSQPPTKTNVPGEEEEETVRKPSSKLSRAPVLDLEKTKEMLEDFLEAYTSPAVQRELNELRKLADYDERRSILRIRKYLPEIQKPILHRYGLSNSQNQFDYQDAKRDMEATVGYWRQRDDETRALAKECWEVVFGDITDA